MVEIKSMIIPISKARSGIVRPETIGITIHNTGNYSNGAGALNHGNYLLGSGKNSTVSWHYCVDDDCITQSIPLNEIAWHAGDGNGDGNHKTIAIEICVNPETNFEKACDNAAELTAHLLQKYSLGIMNVYQHNHWSGKNCPAEIRRGNPYSWGEFLDRVNSHLLEDANIGANPPMNNAPQNPTTKYKVGDRVRFTTCYSASTDPIGFPPNGKAVLPLKGYETGVITKIYAGKNNPYLINDGMCFVNDGDIAQIVVQTSSTPTIKTIKIKAGTWNIRRNPSNNGAVVAVMTGGKEIPYYGMENGWYKIDGGYVGPKAVV